MGESATQGKPLSSSYRLVLGSLAVSAGFVAVLCGFLEPRWETNDDVGMSMVAHGYGIAAYGSPNLIYSNVIWGYAVRRIPEIKGVWGYSTATLGVLVIFGAILAFGLVKLRLGYVGALSVLTLILARPVLFPQFTVNAGLLMVGAVICWNLFGRQKDKRALIIGCFLAFCGYLIRSQESFLVLAIASPLLPWVALRSNRAPKIAFFALVIGIAASVVIDRHAYHGAEWSAFNELNPARAPFTDFGAGALLKQRPDILHRYGYSANDIDLIAKWFFVDQSIANPGKLTAMIKELGPLPTLTNSLDTAWIGVKTLWHPNLFPIVSAALLVALLRPTWRVACVWGLCIAAVFALGLLGRPGILRVYIPLACLLLIAPLLSHGIWRHRLAVGVIIVAALVNMSIVFSESKATQAASQQIREGLKGFPTFPVVIWGGVFPFEAAYPVLKTSQFAMNYRLYGLGVFTLAPFSVASAEEESGHGITDLLMRENGLPIIANEQFFGFLEIYCKEHLNGQLKEISVQHYGQLAISRRQCEVAP